MTMTDAQKRAQKKYHAKLKTWSIRITPELNEKLEQKRKREGLTKKEVLLKYLEMEEK